MTPAEAQSIVAAALKRGLAKPPAITSPKRRGPKPKVTGDACADYRREQKRLGMVRYRAKLKALSACCGKPVDADAKRCPKCKEAV